METTATDGVRLWWEATGDGVPVLLVPGRGDSTDLYPTLFTARLVAAGLRVIRFDPRDTGLSGDGGDEYTLGDLGDDLLTVLDAAGADAAHIVGISMAGLLMSDIASRAPQRVLSLSFISCASPDPDAGMGPDFFDIMSDDAIGTICRSLGSPTEEDRAWVAEEVAAALERAPLRPDAGTRHQDAVYRSEWPTVDDLTRVTAPALIIHGSADRKLPVAHAEAFARHISVSDLVVMDGMGHLARPSEWDTITAHVLAHMTSHPC